MGKWVHRLTNKDIENRTADCAFCGPGIRIKWHDTAWRCKVADIRWAGGKRDNTYLLYKKNSCEKCGWVPVIKEQLDVDHIDGDCSNSKPENLMTLCANCHRLKTFRPDLFADA